MSSTESIKPMTPWNPGSAQPRKGLRGLQRNLERLTRWRRKISLSQVFAGQIVGIREVDDQIWLVSFLDFDLGFFDREEGRVEPAPNPFGPEKVLTMSPE
jgi:hypothetical protein